jgi:hypothetical protein
MSSGYEYDENEVQEAIRKSKERRESEKRSNFFSVEENKDNIFRLLPTPTGYVRRIPFLEVVKHFLTRTVNGETKFFVPNCTLDKHGVCPICARSKELKNKADYVKDEKEKKEIKKNANKIRAQVSYLYTVLNQNNEIGVLELPRKLNDKILDQCENMKRIGGENFVNVYDFQRGRNVIIKMEKKYKQNSTNYEWEYTVTFFPNESAIPANIVEKYTDLFVKPENFIKDYTPQELEMALAGDYSFLKVEKKKDDKDTEFDPKKYEQEAKKEEEQKQKVPDAIKDIPKSQEDEDAEDIDRILNS